MRDKTCYVQGIDWCDSVELRRKGKSNVIHREQMYVAAAERERERELLCIKIVQNEKKNKRSAIYRNEAGQIWNYTRKYGECSISIKGVELRKKDVKNNVHKHVINQMQTEDRKLRRNIIYRNEIKQIYDKKKKKETCLAAELDKSNADLRMGRKS